MIVPQPSDFHIDENARKIHHIVVFSEYQSLTNASPFIAEITLFKSPPFIEKMESAIPPTAIQEMKFGRYDTVLMTDFALPDEISLIISAKMRIAGKLVATLMSAI